MGYPRRAAGQAYQKMLPVGASEVQVGMIPGPAPDAGTLALWPSDTTRDPVSLLRWPLDEQSVRRWLSRLGKTCAQYVDTYERDRAQTVFAIGLAHSEAYRFVRDMVMRGRTLGVGFDSPAFPYGKTSAFGPLPTPEQFADALYAHCNTLLRRGPQAAYEPRPTLNKDVGMSASASPPTPDMQAAPYDTPLYPARVGKDGMLVWNKDGKPAQGLLDTPDQQKSFAVGALLGAVATYFLARR